MYSACGGKGGGSICTVQYMYSRGHRKVPVPFPCNDIYRSRSVPVPYRFRFALRPFLGTVER